MEKYAASHVTPKPPNISGHSVTQATLVFLIAVLSDQANEDVTQVVEMLPSGTDKWGWLTRRLVEFTSSGSVLIFVTKKANCEELATNLSQEGYSLGLLHGDMDQSERNKVISDFKKKNTPVLVATDVAGEYKKRWRRFIFNSQLSGLYIKS